MEFATEVKKGLMEGVKGIPLAIHSKSIMKASPVSKYAMNPFSSPNMSAQKWKNNINTRFRREAAGEVKRILFANNANSPALKSQSQFQSQFQPQSQSQSQPLIPKRTQTPTLSPAANPYIPRPSPYLLKTPINYKTITSPSNTFPYNTKPRMPELRGGYRKTRKNRLRKNSRKLTRRFVKPKVLRY